MGKQDYPTIRAWGKRMGSYAYYDDEQVKKAQASKAPEDAIFLRDDGSWARLSDVTSEETKLYFKNNHPDLFEKYIGEVAA